MVSFLEKNPALKLSALAALIGVIAILFLYVSPGADEPDQFRGIPWGGSARSVEGLTPLAEQGDLKFYERRTDSMQVEGVAVDRIVYGFHKDRFYSAMAYFGSPESFARLKEALGRQYGEVYQLSQEANKLFWNGNTTSLLLTFDDASGSGRVSYFFKPIQLEVEMGQ